MMWKFLDKLHISQQLDAQLRILLFFPYSSQGSVKIEKIPQNQFLGWHFRLVEWKIKNTCLLFLKKKKRLKWLAQ